MQKELEDRVLAPLANRLPESFSRSGRRFIRRSEQVVGMVSIEATSFRWAPDRAYATAELGVRFSAIESWYEEAAPRTPSIGNCHLRCRVGRLLSSGNDHWWNLSVNVDEEPLPELASGAPSELVDAVIDVAVPQLEEFMRPIPAVEWLIGMRDSHLGADQAVSYAAIIASTMPGGEGAWPRIMERVQTTSSIGTDTRALIRELRPRQPRR